MITSVEARAAEVGDAPDPPIRVFVFARDPVSQAGIASQLRRAVGVAIVDGSGIDTAHVAIVAADHVDAEVVHAVRAIGRSNDCPRVVVVASTLDADGVLAAVEAGACGFLRRGDAVTERLLATIRAAATGEGVLPADLLADVDSEQRLPACAPGGPDILSTRELAVLRLVAEGHGTAEIAVRLAYSERTIKNVIHQVVRRLGLRNRCHVVAHLVRVGAL
jgi:DNA-binding NarL/FixJ family response regulator